MLVLSSTFPRWDGDSAPGFVFELSKRLAEHFDVTVLCPHAPGSLLREHMGPVSVHRYRYAPSRWERLTDDGGIVTNLRREPWRWVLVPLFLLMQMLAVRRLLQSEPFDVIHAHWIIPQGLVAAAVARHPRAGGVPVVVTSHGADLFALRGKLALWLKRWVLRRASAITVVSSVMADEVARLVAGSEAPITVQPMGVDLSGRFAPIEGARRNSLEILFVGRLVEKKGVHILLRALPQVLRAVPAVRLTVAGFGPQQPALEAQCKDLGLAEVVEFVGPVAQRDLPSLYHHAAVFAAPFVEARGGDQEGLGLVVLEALGCGCPVVIGDTPGTRDIGTGGLGLQRVTVGDPQALARSLVRVLRDPDTAQQNALDVSREIVRRFDWRVVSEGYTKLLAEVAGCDVSVIPGERPELR